jgi:hypothetical protein
VQDAALLGSIYLGAPATLIHASNRLDKSSIAQRLDDLTV